MIRTRTKYKKKQQKSSSGRKPRSLVQQVTFFSKIFLSLAVLALLSLIYINLNNIAKDYYQFTAKLGFTLEQITVDGQKYTSNDEIGNKLHLKKHMPIFSIALNELKIELEKSPWVKHAVVKRDLPNSIHIYIEERVPVALGQKDRKLYIIDEDGVVINEKDLASHLSLPIIIGESVEIYANELIKILKADKELFKKIDAIIRVSERRWNVKFDNDLEIKLPEENMEAAWEKVIKLYKNNELFLPDITSLDLRVANKIYVEKK